MEHDGHRPVVAGGDLGGSLSGAFCSASSYADAHRCCWLAGAVVQLVSAVVRLASPGICCSGWTTNAVTVLIGWVTPAMCCSETGPIACAAPGVWVYGAPYVAVPLVPSSSVAAVATKSFGSARGSRSRA